MGRLIESVPRHGVKTSYAYDAAGRVIRVTEGERVTRYAYDLAGNVTKATLPDGSETAYRYDANNNPIRVIDALGSETSYRYDTMGRLLSVRQPNGATLRLRYDLAGNLTQETDAMGGKQRYAYDAIGRLTEVTDANGSTTRYGYDALDNLISVTDANGHETRYAYDPLSRLRTETDARGNTTAYDYTPEGWLKQTTRPDGTTLSYTYDKTGYLLKETASDGTEIRHTFDALGELTEIEDETGTTKLRYDERGLLIGVENPLGEHVQYTYNAYGEKVSMTYPDGKQAAYTYDALSRLLSVTEPNGTTTEYTYDALGRRTSTSDGNTTTEYRYDKVGNLTKQANDAVTLTYKYDQNSRMTGETREEGKTTVRTNYAYDKAGQLTSFRRSDGNAERYKYDPAGNMIEKTQNGTKIAMTYTAANELQSMESPHGKLTYAYDQNGNLTQKTYNNRTDTYSYDARNHLRQYKGYDNYTVKYSYNALGMLHAKEATGSNSRTTLEELIAGKESADDPDGDGQAHLTTYTYDLTQPYYEVLTESTDGAVTSYTYGLERLAAYTEQTQTKYLYDGRGSVIQTTSSFGTQTKAYSPFGELLTEKTSGYGFNGEYFDAATGMLNLRARQYEPAQGRFSQKDSEKGNVANSRSLNAYLYCYNDGINYFDASGAKPEVVRNSVTVDPGGGSSAKAVTSASTSKSANTAVKQSRDAAIREANPEEWARSEEARKNAARRATKPTNRERVMLDNPEEAAKLRYKEYYRDVPTVGGLLPESYVCSLAYESYWDRNDGYFDGLWWQDREKLAEAAAMLRLEASRSGGIDIIDVLGRKRLDETNTKMYAIQALANASRSGTWDEQTLIALENSLFSQGRIYNNDTHTLSAADIDALITYEDGIIFREFGNWLEGGGAYIIAGVTMIGMDYFVTHGADRIVDRLYSGKENCSYGENYAQKPYTKSRPSFRKGVVEKVWENAKIEGGGVVRDPNTKEIISWEPGTPRRGVWDMGHIPSQKYSDIHASYMRGEMTKEEFLNWYNDPANYRPEIPKNNRGHLFE